MDLTGRLEKHKQAREKEVQAREKLASLSAAHKKVSFSFHHQNKKTKKTLMIRNFFFSLTFFFLFIHHQDWGTSKISLGIAAILNEDPYADVPADIVVAPVAALPSEGGLGGAI